jgi:hypothetical protein
MLDNRIQVKLLEFAQRIRKFEPISDPKEWIIEVERLVKIYTEEIQDLDKELP